MHKISEKNHHEKWEKKGRKRRAWLSFSKIANTEGISTLVGLIGSGLLAVSCISSDLT